MHRDSEKRWKSLHCFMGSDQRIDNTRQHILIDSPSSSAFFKVKCVFIFHEKVCNIWEKDNKKPVIQIDITTAHTAIKSFCLFSSLKRGREKTYRYNGKLKTPCSLWYSSLYLQNTPSDATALLPPFSKMAYLIQAPPTAGAICLGVSVLFFLQRPVSHCLGVTPRSTELASPDHGPFSCEASHRTKKISKEQGSLKARGWEDIHMHMDNNHTLQCPKVMLFFSHNIARH